MNVVKVLVSMNQIADRLGLTIDESIEPFVKHNVINVPCIGVYAKGNKTGPHTTWMQFPLDGFVHLIRYEC